MMSICHWLACDAPQAILASRDEWRPADVPLQAVGVASLAYLFIGLWSQLCLKQHFGLEPYRGVS